MHTVGKGSWGGLKKTGEWQEAQGAAAAVATSERTAKHCPFHSFPRTPGLQ